MRSMTTNRPLYHRWTIALILLCGAGTALAGGYYDGGHYGGGQQSFRVDVNMYGNGELNIKRWLEKYAGIDPDHYYLTGVIVHSARGHHGYGGHALLRVGSNYAPRTELRPGHNFIPAPRYDDGKWRLYVREGAQVHAVTLQVQPRVRYSHAPGYRNDGWRRERPAGRPFDRHHQHDRWCRH